MAILENKDPTEHHLDDIKGLPADQTSTNYLATDGVDDPDPNAPDAAKPIFEDGDVLQLLGDSRRRARNFQQIVTMSMWENSEAAYRSEHSTTSKYRRDHYKSRSKYFKPKTRAAVRKNLTTTANAFFASQDVMTCEASDTSDKLQRANADLVKELINTRLNNKTERAGVPWFQTVLGARMQTQIMGLCGSKQEWKYKCIETPIEEEVDEPLMHPVTGEPAMDPTTGEPLTQVVTREGVHKDIIHDKPACTIIPIEMMLLDPNTNWINPAQNSPVLIVETPMHIDDVKEMMKDNDKGTTQWRTVSDEQLRGSYYSETELMGLKAAREGVVAQTALNRPSTAFGGLANEIVAVWDCYFRRNGIDYQCWSLKNQALMSEVAETKTVHPAFRGTRPYTIGTDSLEVLVLNPQSHVDSWKQSQDELNDFTNIRMDGNRQSVFPVAKVKAGRSIDHKAVQNRASSGIIIVREQEDVMWDRPNAQTQGVERESQLLSNDFDELAGIFSQGSVQSNRQLNETVGGMQIMSSNANATSEFDLRVFVETWAEPVLSQLVMLEQYYEDDATILAIAGQKADLFQKYGVSEINDELLESQVQLTVNIGMGGADPMQSIAKLQTGMGVIMPLLQQAVVEGKAEIQYDEIANEVFGKLGYKNGADRFIKFNEQGGAGGQQAMAKMAEALKAKDEQIAKMGQELEKVDAAKMEIDGGKLDHENDKLAFEKQKHADEVRQYGADQEMVKHQGDQAHDAAFVEKGLPPGFSFDGMMQMFQAIMQDSAKTRDQLAQAIEMQGRAFVQTSAELRDAVDGLIAAETAPKQITFDGEGNPTGIMTELPA